MQSRRLQAGVTPYSPAISTGEKSEQWQRALGLREEMRSRGLQANVITHNAIISACEKGKQWQRALGLFKETLAPPARTLG